MNTSKAAHACDGMHVVCVESHLFQSGIYTEEIYNVNQKLLLIGRLAFCY